MLCHINHEKINGHGAPPPPLFFWGGGGGKIHVWYSKGVFVPHLRKIHRVEIARFHYLKSDLLMILPSTPNHNKFSLSLNNSVRNLISVIIIIIIIITFNEGKH